MASDQMTTCYEEVANLVTNSQKRIDYQLCNFFMLYVYNYEGFRICPFLFLVTCSAIIFIFSLSFIALSCLQPQEAAKKF